MNERLQNDVDALAERIRELYVHERQMHEARTTRVGTYNGNPMWDGGSVMVYGSKNAVKRECKPIWPKIAIFVLNNRLDPDRFVRAQFFNLGQRRVPAPNHLLGQGALAKYANWPNMQEISEKEVVNSLATASAIFRIQVGDYVSITKKPRPVIVKSVLLDENLSMSVLFRYCMAKREKIGSVAKRYFRAAAWQYTRDKALYDYHWKDFIPEGFSDRALAIYGNLGVKDGE